MTPAQDTLHVPSERSTNKTKEYVEEYKRWTTLRGDEEVMYWLKSVIESTEALIYRLNCKHGGEMWMDRYKWYLLGTVKGQSDNRRGHCHGNRSPQSCE